MIPLPRSILDPDAYLSFGSPALNGGFPSSTAALTHPFWEFQWDLVWHPEVTLCAVVLFFSGILCSAAGIGGGGIYVAVLMVCGRLTPHNAVPLSKAIVFFGSIASIFVNIYRAVFPVGGRAPKSVIDTDACRLVVPATLIGTFLGVLLNRHTSDYIIVTLLTGLLGLMTGMVAQTARKQALEEYADATSQPAEAPSADVQGASVKAPDAGDAPIESSMAPESERIEKQEEVPTTSLLPKEIEPAAASSSAILDASPLPLARLRRKQIPSVGDGLLSGSLLLVVIFGGVFRFHMHACRAEKLGDLTKIGACAHPVNMIFRNKMAEWMSDNVTAVILQQLVWSLPIWMCIAITVYFGFVANREVGWPTRSIMLYQVVSLATGLLAGLVGVGGGLILSPFFVLTGMDPAVAVGTSATCVLFTSSSTTMQYIFTDRIIMSLAVVYGSVCYVASFCGTCLVHFIQERFAKKSYITAIVAFSVFISAILSVAKFIFLVAHPDSTHGIAGSLTAIG